MKTKCIKEEALMDYLEGRLSLKKRTKVEHHLADCDTCLAVLAVTGKMFQAPNLSDQEPVPGFVTQRAVETVKALKKDSLSDRATGYLTNLTDKFTNVLRESFPIGQPALVLVRGTRTGVGEDLIVIKKSFPDMDAEIEIEKKGKEKVLIKVKALKHGKPAKPVRITLFHKDREVASYLESVALFEDIPFGNYVLRFTSFTESETKTREYPFEVRETIEEE